MRHFCFLMVACFLWGSTALAQDATLQRLSAQNRTIKTLSATVQRTRHNTALTNDEVTKGTFSLRKPGQMALTFLDGQDKLLMNGDVYTMIQNGKANVASGKTHELFAVLQDVLQACMGDGDVVDLEGRATLQWTHDENTSTLTVTPNWEGSKRRMMFRSFVFIVDNRTLRLRSLRMNERGDNYTQYDFTVYHPDAPVSETVFQPQ